MKTLIIILIVSFSTCLYSTIINVPADQPTIQAGIDAAVDADTVLVQPGTYFENINYNGNNITVASLFLTTQDTIYIFQTVINGSQNGSVVTFESGEDSVAVLMGFFLTNGSGTLVSTYHGSYYSGGGIFTVDSSPSLYNLIISDNTISIWGWGGGIFCYENSSPSLDNVTISDNSADEDGGGISCWENSNPSLINVTITGNSADWGGGIFCYDNSSPIVENVRISNNSGSGIYCDSSSPSLMNVTISDNSGSGIYCHSSNLSLVNVTVSDNSGSGINCWYSNPSLMNVTISGNSGRGIYCNNSSLSFDPVDRCNIYLNFAVDTGCDLYAEDCETIDVIVDTFTVLQPDDYFACPIDNFTFDILNAKIEQVDQDLYVSPDGSNNNSGLTVYDPLLSISYALTKILADSTNTLSIHLSNGTYSPSGTGEIFPLNCRSYVSLLGEDEVSTILDGEGMSGILFCANDNNFSIENMTIQNGSAWHGVGIYCNNSSPILENVTISGNGGGIHCENSSPSLQNVTISDNNAYPGGGGIYCEDNSNPSLVNVTISGNSSYGEGGGILCRQSSPSLVNVIITGNSAGFGGGGGIFCFYSSPSLVNVTISCNIDGGILCHHSSPSLVNVTISGNTASDYGSGIYCSSNSSPSLINSILWNDSPQEVYFREDSDPNSITISYSDIQGGEAGIVTNNNGTVNWLEGNIDEDPLFVGTGDHPFLLQDLSPCIDAGIPDTTGLNLPEFDLAGNPRVFGGRIDMGAYENQNVVGANENLIPLITKLNQNYPNPFNPSTTINYSLKENSKVSLNIYNIKGQKVKQLVSNSAGQLSAGQYSVVWDGKDESDKPVSSGIYFYKLKAGELQKVRKMILMK